MLLVRHLTVYRYARPVRFGRHRLMFRPRDSHDLRLLATQLDITPPASSLRWLHDAFGNSVALADFSGEASELRFESRITLEQYAPEQPQFPLEDYASLYPFSYAAEEIPDLERCVERHYADPEQQVARWARRFIAPPAGANLVATQPMLEAMMQAIRNDFSYGERLAVGTQPPAETLARRSGSCRDFALFMMEAARSLGLAARFVSGYYHDPGRDPARPDGGSTHAWVQIYLPGAGWVEFDPTNGIVGGTNLIRVAVARDPAQALPLTGTWTGAPGDYLGMTVAVEVRRETG